MVGKELVWESLRYPQIHSELRHHHLFGRRHHRHNPGGLRGKRETWIEDHKVCVEWRESFPDRRLIEIVRKDVDGQTFDQIGDFYGVSGGCIEKRIDEGRELFDRLKALYISGNY